MAIYLNLGYVGQSKLYEFAGSTSLTQMLIHSVMFCLVVLIINWTFQSLFGHSVDLLDSILNILVMVRMYRSTWRLERCVPRVVTCSSIPKYSVNDLKICSNYNKNIPVIVNTFRYRAQKNQHELCEMVHLVFVWRWRSLCLGPVLFLRTVHSKQCSTYFST